jgi:RNA polymerase sigma-70 factor (ECF subfamily)
MGAIQAIELPKARDHEPPPPDDTAPPACAEDPDWPVRFAALAEEHSPLLFRIAYGLLRNPHDAEDAVQESLLRIYRAGPRDGSGAEIADEKAYLARAVWRAGLDIAARRPKRTEPIQGESEDGPQHEFAATGRSAEEELAAGDERALLRRLIDALPEDLRQPLVLSAIEEMTSREVAAALGIPEGTVRTRIMRARAELRKRFESLRARKTDSHG